MNGRGINQWAHRWRKKKIKSWQRIFLFAFFLVLSVNFLRHNNLKMVELRNNVIAADEAGAGVAEALTALNKHVFAHMNTTIVRPIELVNTYNTQVKMAVEAASQGSSRDIYSEAAKVCEKRGVPLKSIAQCAADYASNNNTGTSIKNIVLPDKNRFTYSFATPRWTPDAAGFSLLLTGVLLVWILLRSVEYLIVRLVLRHRLKNNF